MFFVQINNLWNRNSPTQLNYKVMEDFGIIIGRKFNKHHDESQFYSAKKKMERKLSSQATTHLYFNPCQQSVCATNKFNRRELSVPFFFFFVFCESWPHVHVLNNGINKSYISSFDQLLPHKCPWPFPMAIVAMF